MGLRVNLIVKEGSAELYFEEIKKILGIKPEDVIFSVNHNGSYHWVFRIRDEKLYEKKGSEAVSYCYDLYTSGKLTQYAFVKNYLYDGFGRIREAV